MPNFMSNLIAYIDPGVGSIVIQALIAMVLGAGFMLRRVLVMPFGMLMKNKQSSDSGEFDADD